MSLPGSSPGRKLAGIASRLGAKGGDLLLIVAGKYDIVNKSLGQLRQEMGERLGLIDRVLLPSSLWLTFPFWSGVRRGAVEPVHHPFTAPKEEEASVSGYRPRKGEGGIMISVCNGSEISSGSIRIHNREMPEQDIPTPGLQPDGDQKPASAICWRPLNTERLPTAALPLD